MQVKKPTQERSVRHVQRILDAAASEIARVGTGAMSMNRVAIVAGTSPGSLYQFFPAKPALLHALGERFAADLEQLASVAGKRAGRLPVHDLEKIVAAFLLPFAQFYRKNPAYPDLYNALNGPGRPTRAEVRLDQAIVQQMITAMRRLPGAPAERQLSAAAIVMLEASHAVFCRRSNRKSAALAQTELRNMLTAYLRSLLQHEWPR
jgi:AcrR family transcriptional regulator